MNKYIQYPYELPEGWNWSHLESFLDDGFPQYGYTASSIKEESQYKFFRQTDIQYNINWNTVPYCKIKQNIDRFILKHNDILFGRSGNIGETAIIKNPPKSIFASYLIRLRFNSQLSPDYFSHYAHSPSYWNQITSSGTTQPNFNATKVKKIIIPIPPKPEQERIVKKLDKITTLKNETLMRLETIPEQLDLLRNSILDKAFRGKLVPQNPNEKPINVEESEGPYELPKGWKWILLHRCCDIVGGGTPSTSNQDYFSGNIPWFTPSEIPPDTLTFVSNSTRQITSLALKKSSTRLLKPNSIIVTSRASIGNVAINTIESTTNQGFINIIPNHSQIIPKFIAYSILLQKPILIKKASGTTFKEISKTKFNKIPFPIPPKPEQDRIVKKLDKIMKNLEEIQSTSDMYIKKLELLEQSILDKAFRGKL
tara:strand:- start:224 stop:1498 length:1275 start_codon:yes stop_codon:yes gene_type:complete